MDEKVMMVLTHLRGNSRKSLAQISREENIPISTVFEKLKLLESSIIQKHVCLLDFKKLGYSLNIDFVIRVSNNDKENVRDFLLKNNNVNNIFRINGKYNFFIETVFRNMEEVQNFLDKLEEFSIKEIKEHHIVEELKREAFLNKV